MKLPLYIVSDNHFKMADDDWEISRRKRLYSLFDQIKKSGGTLIIGGDFFDFWFDYKYVVPRLYTDLILELSELHQSGIEVHYLAGNHDYWDFGSFKKSFGAVFHTGDFSFDLENEKVLITHGDGLLANDHGYRFMKRIIRSRLCIFLFRNFHSDWGCALAEYVSKTSGEYHHHDDRSESILREIEAYAGKQWKSGYDTVLVGHYHQTGITDSQNKKLIHLGDWLKHYTLTRYDHHGWTQTAWPDPANRK